MNRVCALIVLFLTMGALAVGEPRFLPVLKSTFHIPAGSEADRAGCANCHAGPPVRNVFGKQVEQALDQAHADMLTPQILMSIADKDADGDGYTNGEELRAGFLPGDPKSHPSGHAAGSGATAAPSSSPLIPPHTFHPALVHFPIALYIFGFVLELVALRRKEDKFREGAFWAYVGAALSLLVVVPTGLISCFRQGYSLTPGQPVFTHFLCAIAATVGIIATAIWTRRSRPTGAGYWLLALFTVAALSAAGFFGGALVYG